MQHPASSSILGSVFHDPFVSVKDLTLSIIDVIVSLVSAVAPKTILLQGEKI